MTPVIGPSVWKQPAYAIPSWVARGEFVMFGWEEEDANGKPTKHLVDYLDAALAAGAKVIVQLDAVESIPWNHPAIIAFCQPDEPDNLVVNELGKGAAGNPEGVYATLAANYVLAKKNRPDLPVFVNIDGWQFGWQKADYARIFGQADYVGFDYYENERGITLQDWIDRFNLIKAAAGGKLAFAWIGTSLQNLGTTYYPTERPPTAAETTTAIEFFKAQGMSRAYFSQSFTPFSYDSTPADIVAVIKQEEAGSAPPLPTPTPTPAPTPSPGVPMVLTDAQVAKTARIIRRLGDQVTTLTAANGALTKTNADQARQMADLQKQLTSAVTVSPAFVAAANDLAALVGPMADPASAN